jgi:hypothetical protein
MVHNRDLLTKNTVNDAIQFKSLEVRIMKTLLCKKLFLVAVNVYVCKESVALTTFAFR